MRFASRKEAGRVLGRYLAARKVGADLVLGLPRGGVVVAAEVARILKLPLDTLVVRKIGHPRHREFAVGALAEAGVVEFDDQLLWQNPILGREVDAIIAEETERVREYQARFHAAVKRDLTGQCVLIVDDGLATGATAAVAVRSARRQKARRIVVAVPVASSDAVARLAAVADDVIMLLADPNFEAVGAYYFDFSPTTDEEVLALLRAHQPPENFTLHARAA